MRLDLSRTWGDAVAMLRANGDLVSAIAGMFILLPGILSQWILPDRAPPPEKATLADLVNANAAYVTAHWPVMVVSAILVGYGSLALLAVLVHHHRPTVAEALRLALVVLPIYLLANLVQSLIVMVGLMALVVPGLYLLARMACIAPVAAAEHPRNPLHVVSRSFAITRGNGWRILLMYAVILGVAMILSVVVAMLAGIAAQLLLPPDIGRLLLIIVGALFETALAVVVLTVSAAIYHQGVEAAPAAA